MADASGAGLAPVPFLYLRHGETDWNARGLSQGSVDVALNERGLAQAEAAASGLAASGCRIETIVSSDLLRARQTAAIVGRVLGLPPGVDAGLREASFGDQEGRPMGSWYDDWVESRYTPAGGESFTELRARVVAAINRVVDGRTGLLVVAHGAMFRALRFEMGLSAHVRAENGAAVMCHPGAPWTLEPIPIGTV